MTRSTLISGVLVIVALCAGGPAVAAGPVPPRYKLTILTMPSNSGAQPSAISTVGEQLGSIDTFDSNFSISNRGDIVYAPGDGRGIYWSSGDLTRPIFLRSPNGRLFMTDNGLWTLRVNDRRQIVGFNEEKAEALYWSSPTSKPIILPARGLGAAAFGINNQGVIAGTVNVDTRFGETTFAARWIRGSLRILPHPGMVSSNGVAINQRGQVLGEATTTGGQFRPVIWSQNGAPHWLAPPCPACNDPLGFNDHAQVVGRIGPSNGAWIWQRGQLAVLPAPNLSEPDSSEAFAINDQGVAIGRAAFFDQTLGFYEDHAVVWRAGKPYLLQDLLTSSTSLTLLQAFAMNDHGDILALSVNSAGTGFLTLLTPV